MRDIIVDIDGTVADLSHRRDYISTSPKNWAAFEAGIPFDTPHQHVIDVVNILYDAGWRIVMCSGRGKHKRSVTLEWLEKYGVKFHALYMRGLNDYRRDDIVKSEILDKLISEGYNISFCIDDRNQVVDMFRSRGIPVFQVAPGDF